VSQEFCERLAQCEYDEGYIVLDRDDACKVVWRRRVDVLDIPEEAWPSEPHNEPDEDTIEANLVVQAQHLDTSRSRDPDHLRGQFVPWACLRVPENSGDELAFRLIRGTLLVLNRHRAFLFDIETAELQQTITMHALERLQYIDLSDQHLFIVSALLLEVYDRATGSRVLSIPAGRQPWNFYASPENQWRRAGETLNHGELGFRRAAPPNWAHREDYFLIGVWSSFLGVVVVPIFLTPPPPPHVKFTYPLVESIWRSCQ
jgi:hypothetical protein